MRYALLLATLAVAPAIAQAQGTPPKPAETKPAGMKAPTLGAVAAIKPVYEMVKGWLIKSAHQMPDSLYWFKPTAEVRSFGGIIGHVADANYMLCAIAKGEKNPAPMQDFEKNTERAVVVKGLEDSFTYCDGAYDITDAKAGDQVELFGMKGSKLWLLAFNAAHQDEHYGNLVTYFRLKGLTRPSSQGRGM